MKTINELFKPFQEQCLDKKGRIVWGKLLKFQFLNDYETHLKDLGIKEEIFVWMLKNNVEDVPKCKVCGKNVNSPGATYCSTKCATNDPAFKEKGMETKAKKHGGWDNYVKYQREKSKETCLKNYGVEHQLHSPIVQQKIRKTWDENNQSEKNTQRMKAAWANRTDEERKAISDKNVETCLERYGTVNGGATKEAQEKIVQTHLSKRGTTHHMKTEEGVEKFNSTCQEKYGVDWYTQTEDIKVKRLETLRERYGIENAWQHPNNTDKNTNNKSKLELEVFSILKENVPGLTNENPGINFNGKVYLLDMIIRDKKKFIEFNGDYYHANPLDYQCCQIIQYKWGWTRACDVWLTDMKKISAAISLGWTPYIIWEHDYRENPEKCIRKAIEFLKS